MYKNYFIILINGAKYYLTFNTEVLMIFFSEEMVVLLCKDPLFRVSKPPAFLKKLIPIGLHHYRKGWPVIIIIIIRRYHGPQFN